MKKLFNLQLFAAENAMTTADIEPAISIDCVSKITSNIKELQNVLGIAEMDAMASGTSIKLYKTEVGELAEQVGEGETIGLTKVTRVQDRTIDLTLEKYRKNASAELIQKVGKNKAINQTDDQLISKIQKRIKARFFSNALAGGDKMLTVTGTTLQGVLAGAWGKLKTRFADEDVTPIYFVSVDDVAAYLGNAQVTMQTAFGLSYIENFLGLGTVVVTPSLTKGTVKATAKENLHGAYIPANTGDVGATFGLTADSTGLVGMKHSVNSSDATVDTLIMCGIEFYPEYTDGIVEGTITPAGA